MRLLPLTYAAPLELEVESNTSDKTDSTEEDEHIDSTDIGTSISPTDQLTAAVQRAVNSSLEILGENSSLDSDTTGQLVSNIVTNLLAAGVKTPSPCKLKTVEQLKEQFLEIWVQNRALWKNNANDYLRLKRMKSLKEDIYYVDASSTDIERFSQVRIDPICYGGENHSEGQHECSMHPELRPIVDDEDELKNYFPRYMLQMACEGCSKQNQSCLRRHNGCYVENIVGSTFHPLKRLTGKCDKNGYERWKIDSTKRVDTIGACSCRQQYDTR